MAADFIPTFTRAGLAAVRAQDNKGLQASIAALAIGCGTASGSGYIGYTPDGSETALKGEIARAPLLSGTAIGGVAGSDPIGFRIQSEFPALAAGSVAKPIIEVGVILDDGTLLCVWSSANGAADVLGSLTANAIFDLAFDLYLSAIPASALTITVQANAPPDNLACLAQLLRGVARSTTREIQARYRLARRGIKG